MFLVLFLTENANQPLSISNDHVGWFNIYVIKHLLHLSVKLMFIFLAVEFDHFFILQVSVIAILMEIRPRFFSYFSFASDVAFYPFQGHRNIVWRNYCRVRSNKWWTFHVVLFSLDYVWFCNSYLGTNDHTTPMWKTKLEFHQDKKNLIGQLSITKNGYK